LVCLLESDEMRRLGIPDLLAAARHRGLAPIHLPIVDVSVPTRGVAESLVASLIAQPERAVVIHCNGGLGRSGVIAGCLLRALGMDAEQTLRGLRAARGPECPQTEEQREFVRRFGS
jgi:protein-tyrosine phosphatase